MQNPIVECSCVNEKYEKLRRIFNSTESGRSLLSSLDKDSVSTDNYVSYAIVTMYKLLKPSKTVTDLIQLPMPNLQSGRRFQRYHHPIVSSDLFLVTALDEKHKKDEEEKLKLQRKEEREKKKKEKELEKNWKKEVREQKKEQKQKQAEEKKAENEKKRKERMKTNMKTGIFEKSSGRKRKNNVFEDNSPSSNKIAKLILKKHNNEWSVINPATIISNNNSTVKFFML